MGLLNKKMNNLSSAMALAREKADGDDEGDGHASRDTLQLTAGVVVFRVW